jgi:lipopolysaccharide/colanic/teichoic acid biosynthesis glycosyltransferase
MSLTHRDLLTRILGAILLALSLPLALGTAALIWLDDGLPLFFTQTRVGKNGRPFRLIKFRTLTTNAEGTKIPSQHTIRTGSVLRRLALDELPQLWNVVQGEMNLVGPRPVLPAEANGYDDWAVQRLTIRPGLTGWAQVCGRNAFDWRKRIEHDLWYVQHRDFLLDVWILAKTPFVLLVGRGVYGPGTDDPSPSEVRSHFQRHRS